MRKNSTLPVIVILASCGLSPCGQAAAASFDCAKAAGAREKLICATPDLSRLDDQLAAAYGAAQERLSEAGRTILQGSQRSWLRYSSTVCPLGKTGSRSGSFTPAECLAFEYRKRLETLKQAGQRIGPYVFNRVYLFQVTPAPAEMPSESRFYTQEVSYPQIDNPDSPMAAAWNKANQRSLQTDLSCDGAPSDSNIDYIVTWASRQLISVSWSTSNSCHGAPHGVFSTTNVNTLLRPGLPTLQAADMFGPGNAWIPKLQALFQNELTAGHTNNHTDPSTLDMDEFNKDVVSAGRWNIGSDGITVSFASYELGCYACNPGPVTVPWPALKPLLVAGAVVP